MTEKTTSLINIPSVGNVEIISLIVTAILAVVCYLVGSRELAFGVAAGGVLFTANFVAIRFVVNALVSNTSSTGFGIFAFIIKMLIFVGIVASLFIFTDVNIYGFFIGVTGVVIVIIGESLRRSTNGSL
ncbi:MAG: ATP synthase subunit I [Deltaproteobacteria bacterium]|nr:ATP synthase subunit I [Deltaproteobacteria bacterium]MCK5708940.1 ATP synthase subunit I [Deltaproteobacteria bacterium]